MTTPWQYLKNKPWHDPVTWVGFAVPFAITILLGVLIHSQLHPIAAPIDQASDGTPQQSAPVSTTMPTADDVASAKQAVLQYCQNDLRKDTSCRLSNAAPVTAPGFVEVSIVESGQFEGSASSMQGLGLAKSTSNGWQVIWVGQGCVPQNVAAQNQVPTTFSICSS